MDTSGDVSFLCFQFHASRYAPKLHLEVDIQGPASKSPFSRAYPRMPVWHVPDVENLRHAKLSATHTPPPFFSLLLYGHLKARPKSHRQSGG